MLSHIRRAGACCFRKIIKKIRKDVIILNDYLSSLWLVKGLDGHNMIKH